MTEPVERDDHLCQALRHAPDADVAPPHALSEAIRRQARAAVGSPGKRFGWRRWLAAPVAPWATGLAGIVVATTVALLWRLDPAPDAVQPPLIATAPHATAADAARNAAPTPAHRAHPEAKSTDSVAPADRSRSDSPGPAAVAPGAEMDLAKERRSKAQPTAAPKPATPEYRPETRERELPAVGATSGIAAAAGTAQDERRNADTSAEQSTRAVARRAEAEAAGTTKSSVTPAPTQERRAPPVAEQRAQAEFAASGRLASPPLASRLAALDAGTAGAWRMRVDADATEREIDAAARAWLARLVRETGANWVPSGPPLPEVGRALRFSEDGRLAASLRLTDTGILWRDEGSGQTWFAPLDGAQRDRLGWP